MGISKVAFGNTLRPGICTSTTRPTVPYGGQLIYETDTLRYWSYNSTAGIWVLTMGSKPHARAIKSGTQAITTGTNVALTWTGADTYDTDLIHDPASNNSRMVVPAGLAGVWRFSYSAFLAAGVATSVLASWIEFNRAGVAGGARYGFGQVSNNAASGANLSGSGLVRCAAGDYAEVFFFQNSGGTLNVGAYDFFDAEWVGPL